MSSGGQNWASVPVKAAGVPASQLRCTARLHMGRIFLLGLAAVVMAACLLLVLLSIGTDTGVAGFVAGFTFALVPVFMVLPALLWLDRLEAEPVGQLLFAFGWGAVVATFIALMVNTYSLQALTEHGGDISTAAIFVAPWVEEVCKGAAVLLVLLWRRREFDGIVDGIVYAGLAGLGFAFTENVLYLGRSLQENGSAGLVVTFVLRCIFGPFAHPLFTMAFGVGLGLATRTRRGWLRVVAPVTGLVVAVALHGLWNLSAVAGLRGFVGLYIAVQMPLFVAAVVFAIWARRREGRLITTHLQVYVASGWLAAAEVEMLGSMRQRRTARAWAQRVGGARARGEMRAFQATATELAFARDRASRAVLNEEAAAIERDLLLQITAHRYGFLPSAAA